MGDFERQDFGDIVAYALAGDFDYGYAKLMPSQAKRLLAWLQEHEQQLEQDILTEQAYLNQHDGTSEVMR